MLIVGFTFASFMISMNKEPRFKSIGIQKCKETMYSYPNGLSKGDVDFIFKNHKKDLGSIFFKRDSTIFMMDVEEEKVILKHIISNEYDMSKFCASYFDIKNRVDHPRRNTSPSRI